MTCMLAPEVAHSLNMALSKLASATRCGPRATAAASIPRVGVVAWAKGSQKNQGLYFEYESVDPKAHEEVVQEKEKVQEEFSWVRRARDNTKRHLGLEEQPRRKGGRQSGRRQYEDGAELAAPPAGRTSATPAEQVARPIPTPTAAPTPPAAGKPTTAPVSAPAPAPAPVPAAAASTSAPSADEHTVVRGASSKPAATVLPPVVEPAGDDAPEGMSARKRQLLARMKAMPPPAPALTPSTPTTSASAPAAPNTRRPTAPSKAPQPAAAALGTSAVAAAATAAAQVVRAAPLQGVPSLPALGTGEGVSAEEAEAEELLRALLSPELGTVSGDAEDVLAAEVAAEREFDTWMQQLRGARGEGGGEKDEEEEALDGDELRALLGELNGADGDVSALFAGAREELSEFKSLLQALGASSGAGADEEEVDGDDVEGGEGRLESQVLAALQRSDPALYALLTSALPMEDDADADELGAALASFEGMGLGGAEDGEGGEDVGGLAAAAGRAAASTQASGAQVEEVEEQEELMSDDELARLAATDPDLAALLRGDNAAVESAVKGLAGEDGEDDEDDGEMDEGEGVEFSDLFDAIDEDPDISEEDKERARYELQSMFNTAAQNAPSNISSKRGGDNTAGAINVEALSSTTTGSRKGGVGMVEGLGDVPLMPKPKPRKAA